MWLHLVCFQGLVVATPHSVVRLVSYPHPAPSTYLTYLPMSDTLRSDGEVTWPWHHDNCNLSRRETGKWYWTECPHHHVSSNYTNSWTQIRHYFDVVMGTIASLITRLTSVYSTIHSGADERIYQSSASLAFVRGFHRRLVNSPHKWPVTRKMFPFDDVIMNTL